MIISRGVAEQALTCLKDVHHALAVPLKLA